ncbi:uncharacterized protein LOC142318413 [Lycorma delicatula]|uniref:uncharacterized protein LOC142318413 n=1 Tax=Lycorma delicatula TaxID=130591 RepID=UPI003F5123B6
MQMFGTKIRSWMETHIVRSRKKQHRNKDATTKGKLVDSSSKSTDDKNFDRIDDKVSGFCEDGKTAKASMSLQPQQQNVSTLTCPANNLSSPESAYSTGYSTDGTSPGASIPPEYYINIRTGTHYFQSQGKETDSNRALVEEEKDRVATNNTTVLLLTPRTARRRREDAKRKPKQPAEILHRESSTEEDIIERIGKNNNLIVEQTVPKAQYKIEQPMNNSFHRRTESYDESQCRPELFFPQHPRNQQNENERGEKAIAEKDSGDSSSALTNVSYQCTSPYLSSASPRQRNRIRTNPWLGPQQTAHPPSIKNYNSQGETSSTVGSSSTLSSSGCRNVPAEAKNCFSPKIKEKKKLIKEELKGTNNVLKNSQASVTVSPVVRNRRLLTSVTTCSPQLNRPCRHVLHHARSASSSSSSSTSSSRSSASNDEHHGNTSDFSDDDVTLNEMLGKFDESYVYEKETDILSDSDPTDCEEQPDYNEDKVVNDNANSLEGSHPEELDFIDNGSLAELAYSDSECSASVNTGHCTYYQLPGYTPEMAHKRIRESVLRRHRADSSRRHREKDISRGTSRKRSVSQNKHLSAEVGSSNELISQNSSRRSSTKRRVAGPGRSERKTSTESLPKCSESNIPLRHPCRPNFTADHEKKCSEMPGKHLNLNRVLMERLINNQRNGTRSADGTPISLRRNASTSEYNGKYLRNHCVSKLINSNVNLNDRRNSFDMKVDTEIENKRRSNSLTAYSSPVHQVPINIKPKEGNEVNDSDKEGDLKYRRLIQEAENILEDFQVKTKPEYLSPTFRIKNETRVAPPMSPLALKSQKRQEMFDSVIINSDTLTISRGNNNLGSEGSYLLNAGGREISNGNEDGLLKTISKTLERIIARSTSDTNRKLDKSVSDPFQPKKRGLFTSSIPPPLPPVIYENRESLRRASNLSNNESIYSNSQIESSLLPGFNSKMFDVNNIVNCSVANANVDNNDNTYKNKTLRYCNRAESMNSKEVSNIKIPYESNNPFNSDIIRKTQDPLYSTYKISGSPVLNDRSTGALVSPNINATRLQKFGQQVPWHHRNSDIEERYKNEPTVMDNFRKSSDNFKSDTNQKHSLTTFQSFDLGNGNVVGSRYCPQSEPVKRKVYSCSATFGKLQKSLMRKNSEHISNQAYSDLRISAAGVDERNRNVLKEKVAQLRRERIHAESRVRETKEQIERLKLGDNSATETG